MTFLLIEYSCKACTINYGTLYIVIRHGRVYPTHTYIYTTVLHIRNSNS